MCSRGQHRAALYQLHQEKFSEQGEAPVQQGLPGQVEQEADVVRHGEMEVEQVVKFWTISRTVWPHWLVTRCWSK